MIERMKKELILILHNIRSAHNVGSLFRTADAAGVSHIYITGYTPAPIDRFGREEAKIAKTALGAENTVVWSCHKTLGTLLDKLRKERFYIVALEQSKNSVDYRNVKSRQKTVLILGNEVRGLSKHILEKADIVAEIPMVGSKESLNVSVAGGIMLFSLLEK